MDERFSSSTRLLFLCSGPVKLHIEAQIVALIAGMTSGTNAKRTSLIHLFFNVSGVVTFLLVGFIIKVISGGVTFGSIFQSMFPDVPQEQD